MNAMLAQVHSLPDLLRDVFDECDEAVRVALPERLCATLRGIHVTGCGDSHHAAVSTELAFAAFAGVPTRPLTALQMGRYAAEYLPRDDGSVLVVGISVSGSVARTAEAVALAGRSKATTLALTAAPDGRLAGVADHVLLVRPPDFPDPTPHGTPGVRSYAVNQLALLLLAIHIGECRGRLDTDEAEALRRELRALASASERTIAACEAPARGIMADDADVRVFVFVGGGPNYGTALFSAAKVLEASGDVALGQDTEEWAHLEYYLCAGDTLTVVVSAGDRDRSRALEVLAAARGAGSRTAAVVPAHLGGAAAGVDRVLPFADGVREAFSPVVAAIPGELLAASRADRVGAVFFGRDRPLEVSRIRTSETIA
jgi:glutamine---fructose-6-phosphate transaminase (isomerizing)